MVKWTIEKILLGVGIIFLVVGVVIVASTIPSMEQSMYPYDDAVTELAKSVPPINATKIIIGIVIMVAGFILLFFGKLTRWRK